MNEEKLKKAELLLAELGEIDDGLLCEAAGYRKKHTLNVRAVAMAASFAIIVALVSGSALVKHFVNMLEAPGAQGPSIDAPFDDEQDSPLQGDTNNGQGSHYSLDLVLTTLVDKESFAFVTDPDELPYLDENAYIVWRYEDGGRYYISKPLKNAEFDTIKEALGKGEYVGSSSPATAAEVWVLLGDGRVISPYLELSSGNISSKIFKYEVEIVPDEDLIKKIQSVLT